MATVPGTRSSVSMRFTCQAPGRQPWSFTWSQTALWRPWSVVTAEGLEGLQVDLVGPVGVQELGGRMAEPQALLDQALGDAEARSDRGYRHARFGESVERDHLVGGVHGDADHVLCEGELSAIALPGNQARHGVVLIQHPLAGEGSHGGETAPASDDRVAADAVLA